MMRGEEIQTRKLSLGKECMKFKYGRIMRNCETALYYIR